MTKEVQKPEPIDLGFEGGPAFPCPTVLESVNDCVREAGDPGMTSRRWLAGLALQGLVAGRHFLAPLEIRDMAELAAGSYAIADAMLEHEREEVRQRRAAKRRAALQLGDPSVE